MSEFKGTKTEWELLKGASLLGVQIGKTIFGISNINEVTKANALLISKAPEMLEMLNRFMEITRELNHPRLDHLRWSANKLIKEATEF